MKVRCKSIQQGPLPTSYYAMLREEREDGCHERDAPNSRSSAMILLLDDVYGVRGARLSPTEGRVEADAAGSFEVGKLYDIRFSASEVVEEPAARETEPTAA